MTRVPPARAAPRPRRAGFTLIEAAIALGVAATLLGLAAPSLSGLLARHRTLAAVRTMHVDVALARAQAVERRLDTHVSVRTGRDWCYAVSVAQPVDCHAPAPNVLVLRLVRGGAGGVEMADGAALAFAAGSGIAQPPPGGATLARFVSGHGHRARLHLVARLGRAGACSESGPLGVLPPCAP